MEKNKYKIMVLTDLKNSTSTTLKSTVSLATMIDGEIEVFSVKKATDVVERENQLSSMRTINDQHKKMETKMKRVIEPILKDYGMNIPFSFAFGNVKSELESYIKEQQPDIIVLGKRKNKPYKLIGDSITQFVLNTFNGVVMIAAENNALEPNKELSLGVLNDFESSANMEFASVLLGHTKKPVKSFKINRVKNVSEESKKTTDLKTIDFVFEDNGDSMKNISNYLLKSDVNLLYFDRGLKNETKNANQGFSDINNFMNSMDVSLLLGSR